MIKIPAKFINQPRDRTIEVKYKNGKAKMQLKFNNNFAPAMNDCLHKAQCFVDKTCIAKMDPYTPRRTGILIESATIGTVIGSGEIHQIAPYARWNYYANFKHSTAFNPKAGRMWFERMKFDEKDAILRGAQKILTGKQ